MTLDTFLDSLCRKAGLIRRKATKARVVRLPQDKCMHTVWGPESKQNGWRETCRDCGLQAAGSCQ